MSSSDLAAAKADFIQKAITNNALLFGSFTLKSGRVSPYFFNAGRIDTGSLLTAAADAYAHLLNHSRIPEFDVLFGPAYKGIPLAAATAVALARQGRDLGFCYNRKEKKDVGFAFLLSLAYWVSELLGLRNEGWSDLSW